MSKRVFVSADWKEPFNSSSWDRNVVDKIRQWNIDSRYGVEIALTDDVKDSVMDNDIDCRRCDIKGECGSHINWSSLVIVVIGDKTSTKCAGACDGVSCSPAYSNLVKRNCKYSVSPAEDIPDGNKISYLQYEITKAVLVQKPIILVFNSTRNEEHWIPTWYNTLKAKCSVNELCRVPFWKNSEHTQDCYQDIKGYLQ